MAGCKMDLVAESLAFNLDGGNFLTGAAEGRKGKAGMCPGAGTCDGGTCKDAGIEGAGPCAGETCEGKGTWGIGRKGTGRL